MIALIVILILAAPVYAAPGVAVVQSAAPTTNGGTQDFTSTGFGTPVCAMFFVGQAATNGTEVNNSMYSVGFSDFTNHASIAHADEDTATTSNTGGDASATDTLLTLLSTTQATDGTATAATITDGVRLTWADAPPTAYLVTAVMFNSAAVANCTVGSLSGATSVGGTASVSGLGWQPDVVLGALNNSTTNARTSLGAAVSDSGIVQYAIGQAALNNSATTNIIGVIRSDRFVLQPLDNTDSSFELTSFDSGGFTLTTRDGTTAKTIRYLAMKLQTGIAAKLIACDSPTSTGAKSCTGTGWTPQAGIFYQTSSTTLGTYHSSGPSNEAYGISAFTASQSSTVSIWTDDGVATANTTSIVDSKPVRLRNNASDYLTATLTGFQSDGVDLNYSVVDATARLGALLLFQASPASTVRRRGVILLP